MWIVAFFPPLLSHLMVLFKNMWGQTKCTEEGSLPTFNKNYRCQWELCLSSNCSFDPRIWCMTTLFYRFCINAEKWPPCLLNHMKRLNLSSPPACSRKKKNHIHPWLHEITLQSSCIDLLWCCSHWNIFITWIPVLRLRLSNLFSSYWKGWNVVCMLHQITWTQLYLSLIADLHCISTASSGHALML